MLLCSFSSRNIKAESGRIIRWCDVSRNSRPIYCFNSRIQVIIRKRHRAVLKVSARSLMRDVGPVHDDVAGQDVKATMPEWCRVGFGKKANRLTTALDRDGIYLWQRYTNSMYQKLVYADLCNLGMKTSLRCGN